VRSRRHHRHHGHGRLFWRVYLNGLLLLVLVAVAVVTAAALVGPHGPGMRPERIAEFAAAQTADVLRDPDRLQAVLQRAHDAFGIEVAVYEGDRLVAANVEPPPPPLPGAERPRLVAGSAFRIPGPGWTWAAPLRGAPGAYAVFSGGWRPHQVARVAVVIGAILLALAIASVPLAGSISAPIERLTQAVRRLGEGDLSARVGPCGRGEVGDLGRAFDEMAGRLERLVRAERELLANVSHELRTPLARIRVALELAAEGDQARARRYLQEIGTDLTELERMVEDVLSAARLDLAAGDLPLRRQPVDLAALLSEAAARFRELRPARSLALQIQESPGTLDADPALLRRALDNLLDNAAKYSDQASPVTLRARGAGAERIVEVQDQGIGIDPSDLARLFTPFFRTDRSRARGTGGVGLGLALVKRIVEAHGGTVEVESLAGQGTTFRLRLPAVPSPVERAV
jgi:two-component system OmpR family sensor kinase